MAKYLFILSFFLYFNCHAQSYIGKSRNEIYQLFQNDFNQGAKLSFNTNSEHTYIKIINDYETLYYYLEEDVCVKFVVWKPYSCKCLDTDIQAYNEHLVSEGKLKWKSKDESKIYDMTLYGNKYSLSIQPYRQQEDLYSLSTVPE